MALTLAQLKEIADWVYNQPTPTNSYSSQNPMRKYYITVSSEDSKIYTKDDGVVAIFSNRTLPYTDNEEVKSMTAKIPMDAQIPSGTTVGVNWKGIGATADVKTIIRNACIFLGVKVAKNIDTVNPVVYNEMVNICRDFADNINRIPYYYCKDVHNGIRYLSFIPLDILVNLAIYLNGMGLFLQNKELYEPGYYPYLNRSYFRDTILRDYCPTLSDWYSVQDKDTFFKNFKIFYNLDDSWDIVIKGFKTAFDNQINYNDCIKLSYNSYGTLKIIEAKVIPMSCIFSGDSNGYRPSTFTNGISYSEIINVKEDWYYNTFEIVYDSSKQEFTQSSNLSDYKKYYYLGSNSFTGYSNLKFNKFYKTYRKEVRFTSTVDGLYVDGFAPLQDNTAYSSDVLKFTKLNFLHMYNEILYQKVNESIGSTISDNDFIIVTRGTNDSGYDTYIIKVFKNVISMSSSILNTLSLGMNYNSYRGQLRIAKKSYSTSNWTYDRIISGYIGDYSSNRPNILSATFNFGRQTLIQTYDIPITFSSDLNLLNEVTTDQYIITSPYINHSTLNFECSNLGEIVEFGEQESYVGFELDGSATYPTGVVDMASFLSTYPNRITPIVGNPLIMSGEIIANQRSLTTWVECSISDTPPATQGDSISWTLDDTTPDDRDKISDDIKKSADDDDSDDSNVENDDGKDKSKDDGETPVINPIYLPNLSSGLAKQYKFIVGTTASNGTTAALYDSLMTKFNFSDLVQAFAYGNPINGVVNFAITYDGLWNDTTATDAQVIMWNSTLNYNDDVLGSGTILVAPKISNSITYKELGEIDFTQNTKITDLFHENYSDIVDTEISLYLPFVGIINLNVKDFYNGKLKLNATIESFTGTILYEVFSIRDNKTKLITTASGNCQGQVPLKSSDMTQLLRNIGNATVALGGAVAGGMI